MATKPRLVKLTWEDIVAPHGGGWTTEEEVKASDVVVCHTVGWIIKETRSKRGRVWIVSTLMDDGEGGAGHAHIIPKGCIVKREYLDEKGSIKD